MVVFSYNNKEFYIDGILHRDLTTKVYPELKLHDKDAVFLVDGGEGTGKSKFADILGAHGAKYLGVTYDLRNVCLSPEEFRTRIQDCPKNSVVIYDEAHKGMGSRRALSEINNILIDLMMEMRQKNLLVYIVMPSFFLLDKYAALFRSKGLFHVYERKRKRGFWVYYNQKNKKLLFILGKKLLDYNCMKFPKYKGRFLNQYCVDEAAYRAKKLSAFRERPTITASEKFKDQRDVLIKTLFDVIKVKQSEFRLYLLDMGIELKKTMISDIIKKYKYEKDSKGRVRVVKHTENMGNSSDSEELHDNIILLDKESDDLDGGEGENEEF